MGTACSALVHTTPRDIPNPPTTANNAHQFNYSLIIEESLRCSHCMTDGLAACARLISTRATEEPPGANGHHFCQASEGGGPRPQSWTLHRYTHTHTLTSDSYLTSKHCVMPRFLHSSRPYCSIIPPLVTCQAKQIPVSK